MTLPFTFRRGVKLTMCWSPATGCDQLSCTVGYSISVQRLLLVQSKNRTATSNLDKYLNNLKALIGQTDDLLSSNAAASVMALVSSAEFRKQMDDALNERNNWKTTDEMVDQLRALESRLSDLPAAFPNNTSTITGDPCSGANVVQLGWNDWGQEDTDNHRRLRSDRILAGYEQPKL